MNVTGHASRPPSIRDVASAAGVSYQTVSRVINDHPSVRLSTRERVLAVIDELGFRRSAAAHALASGRTRAVTVLSANTTLYGYANILQGIEEAARAASFAVGISVLEHGGTPALPEGLARCPKERGRYPQRYPQGEEGDPEGAAGTDGAADAEGAAEAEGAADAARRAVQAAADAAGGLIVIAYDPGGVRALTAVPARVPVVGVVETPAEPPGAGSPWVWTDDRKAAREATRHLLDLGHRTVHYVSIPSSTHTSQRMAGWRDALRAAGASEPAPVAGSWDPGSGYAVVRRLARDPAVTAILCGNDDLAIGALRALHEAGRAVPDEVSVIGFDDAPHAAYTIPSLTTVRLDFAGLGRAAFALLHSVMEEAAPVVPHPVSTPELVIRESAGPPGRRSTALR